MAQFPVQPPKAPVAFEHGSGFGKSTPAKVPASKDTAQAQPKPKDHATSTHGTRNHDNGSMVYKTGEMVIASRLLQARVGKENPNTCPRQDPDEGAVPGQDPARNAAQLQA